jgi:hypothetical protein
MEEQVGALALVVVAATSEVVVGAVVIPLVVVPARHCEKSTHLPILGQFVTIHASVGPQSRSFPHGLRMQKEEGSITHTKSCEGSVDDSQPQ